jgi:hypothetical protein
MTNHDELLARLESIAGPGWDLPEQAAAEIRELRAVVLAEGGEREPVAWMYEHDGQVYDKLHPPFFTTEPWSVVEEPWTETPLYAAPIAPPP